MPVGKGDMAVRRISTLVATIALALSGLVVVAGPVGADGVLTPSAASVAVGGTLSVQASGCDAEVEDEHSYRSQQAQLSLVTGTGDTQRAISFAGGAGGAAGVQFTIPGWVDPDEPAELRGVCIEYRYHFDSYHQEEVELFAYPTVPIDITPADDDPRLPTVFLDRSTAAGGQVIVAHVSGCRPGEYVGAALAADTDLALSGTPRFVASTDAPAADAASTRLEIPLVDQTDGGPLAEGDYVLLAVCYSWLTEGESTSWMAEPSWVYVRGTTLVGSMAIENGATPGTLVITGDRCTDDVEIRLAGYEQGPTYDPIAETLTVTPEADGTWSVTWVAPGLAFQVMVTADCGDPTADGYRYPQTSWWDDGYSDQWIGRISPTSSPVGGPVDIHVQGGCSSDDAVVQILGAAGEVLAEAPVEASALPDQGRARLTAPSDPGDYTAQALCGGRPGYPDTLEVFAPAVVSATAPLPPGPTTGWPSSGAREIYNGLIGPISLPAHHGHAMTDMPGAPGAPGADDPGAWAAVAVPTAGTGRANAAGLGPSGLGIPVPRPDGDFAITKLTVDLVDAEGNPVGTDRAHLHHFVVADLASTNPACPTGTFGLPGEIIAAAGAERTPIAFGDPYGLVVDDSDPWAGVYELMSLAAEDQTVFLSYDMEIRRDIEHVRPVRTYFGSATGCGSFTWTIDGSGTPDSQSHYLTIADDGVLVGAGGHLHNGGEHTELFNDRGRLLCRNELIVTGGHHGPGVRRERGGPMDDPAEMTTTTMGEDDWPVDLGPPEMYPDDPTIESISPCTTHERVQAGERLRFTTTYTNDRPRSGVMGIFVLYVWEGGGPPAPDRPRGDPMPRPSGPLVPTGPGEPAVPTAPADPGGPTTSTVVGPTQPAGPTDPSAPAPPTSPSGPGRPPSASARPAGAASPAVPRQGSAAYTG